MEGVGRIAHDAGPRSVALRRSGGTKRESGRPWPILSGRTSHDAFVCGDDEIIGIGRVHGDAVELRSDDGRRERPIRAAVVGVEETDAGDEVAGVASFARTDV